MTVFYRNCGFLTAILAALTVSINVISAPSPKVSANSVFEITGDYRPRGQIDALVLQKLESKKIKHAWNCSDTVFIRRVYLDVIGTLPTADEVRAFLNDRKINKRSILIDRLLKRDEFASRWALKWCDLLRVKAEFPINLWPNAVQCYSRWILDALKNNMPYDRFARELLVSSGSNFRVPQVNFYRAVQDHSSTAIAAAVAVTFMGTRIEKWPEARRKAMEQFFSRVSYKGTAEWKEQIVYFDPSPFRSFELTFPDGSTTEIAPGKDPRTVFADWLLRPENPYFARNIVNRIWSWLMGYGIINEADDMRSDNPPSNAALLDFLAAELVRSHYDLRHIYRLILNSQTYQQSSIAQNTGPEALKLFAFYPVRQLDAEILIDAINSITGSHENYDSPIPEPFTFIPSQTRSMKLADGSITSSFLELFGRPARDTGLESERTRKTTEAQRLHMLNSSHIQNKINRNSWLRKLDKVARKSFSRGVRLLYLKVLSRYPTEEEIKVTQRYFIKCNSNLPQALSDLLWALINSKEFIFNH